MNSERSTNGSKTTAALAHDLQTAAADAEHVGTLSVLTSIPSSCACCLRPVHHHILRRHSFPRGDHSLNRRTPREEAQAALEADDLVDAEEDDF